ncbi:hypothetical protein [Aureimonas sp. AU12]|uniref:hypothetical protein n=1 Tax=Aureimonas sp. AU12 TaxID=1638161 RepID=UPI0007854994|nr:hypothetical protein [Aureimonas sp. AU12]
MRAFEATIAAIILVAGIVLGWLGGCFYADLVSIPAAREAGRIEERLVWTKRQAEAEARAAADRQAAQIRIDAIEREYFERDKARVLQMDALEQSLQEEQANVPTPSPAARGAPPVCRPAIPRGVRDALDAAGRGAAARPPAGEPPAALR